MIPKTPGKTLRLDRSTLRHLTPDGLRRVAGGQDLAPRETIDEPFVRRTR